MRIAGDHGLHGALRYWPVPELVALDLPGGIGFVDALRAIWDTGDAAAPLDPRLPARGPPGACSTPCAPPGSSAPTGSSTHCPTGWPSRRATRSSSPPRARRVSPKAWCSPTTPSPRRRGRPRRGSASTRTRHAWLACLPLAHIGGLAVVTRAIVTGTPLVVLPGFEAEAVEAAGRSGPGDARLAGGHGAAAARPLGLRLRAARRQQGARRTAAQRRRHLRHDRDGLGRGLRRMAARRGRGGVAAPSTGVGTGAGRSRRRGGRDPRPGAHAVPLLSRRERRAGRGPDGDAGLVRHR